MTPGEYADHMYQELKRKGHAGFNWDDLEPVNPAHGGS